MSGGGILTFLKVAFGSATYTSTAATVAANIAGAALVSTAASSVLGRNKRPEPPISRYDVTNTDTLAPRTIVYGEGVVSGPLAFRNVAGTDDQSLYAVVPFATHLCDSIEEIWIDGKSALASNIDWDPAALTGDGSVDSGDLRGNTSGPPTATYFQWLLGDDAQAALSFLTTPFSEWTTSHRLRGCCYGAFRTDLFKNQEEIWRSGVPRNYRARIRGKPVYDPRLDSTQTGGAGSQDRDDPTTWTWSDNPALIAIDYLRDSRFGRGVDESDIDWSTVMDAADDCDASVTIPDGAGGSTTQARFSCNGVLDTSATHRENMRKILATMHGALVWRQGLYRLRAGVWQAPTLTITDDWLAGSVELDGSLDSRERFNRVSGHYIDASRDYKPVAFLSRSDTTYRDRDGGEIIDDPVDYDLVNNEYQAQRLALLKLRQSDNQQRLVIECNWLAMQVALDEVVTVTLTDPGISSETFRVVNRKLKDLGVVELQLVEDGSSSYADPALGDYTERTASGVITFPSNTVPAATNLAATALPGGARISFDTPASRRWEYAEVYIGSTSDSFGTSTFYGEFKASPVTLEDLTPGTARRVWIRLRDFAGSVSSEAGPVQVTPFDTPASTLCLETDVELDGTPGPGEGNLIGVTNGLPDRNVDGFIFWNGSKITVPRAANAFGNNQTFWTGAPRSRGHLCLDTALTDPFTLDDGAGGTANVAFVRRNGSAWEYDNNTTWVGFTPTSAMVSLGPMDAGGDQIFGAGLWGQPIKLTEAPNAASGLWSEIIDDDGNQPEDQADVTRTRLTSVVINAGFELGTNEGWDGGSGTVVNVGSNAHRGDYVMRVDNGTGGPNALSALLDCFPGEVFEVSAWARRDPGSLPSAAQRLGMRWYNAAGTNIQTDTIATPDNGVNTWQHVKGTVAAPENAVGFRIDMGEATGSGRWYWDDVVFNTTGAGQLRLNGRTVSHVGVSSSFAGIRVNSDGTVDMREGGSYTQIAVATDWIRPLSLAPGSYRVRCTVDSGSLNAGSDTDGSFLALTSDREWYVGGTTTDSFWIADVTIEIDDGNGNILADAVYQFQADTS